MSPSGMSWRCSIAPSSLASSVNGARLIWNAHDSPLTVHDTSTAGAEYFGWTDAASMTPSALARRFVEDFPDVVAACRGSDVPYAGWYVEMLGRTYPNRLPYALADWDHPEDCLSTAAPRTVED